MVFNPIHPIHDGIPESDPVRENFIQLSVHHKGNTEPPAKAAGFIWWDTSVPTNEKLRAYTGSAWVDLFNHMESTPEPTFGGAASWQGFVKDKDLTDPPGSPSTGDRYIVAAVATGDWVGEEDNIAEWDGFAWVFAVPEGGWTVWVEDDGEVYVFNGASWGMESFGPHAATHQYSGSDEISVASLSGLLATAQTPIPHAASHKGDGSDAVAAATTSVAGLMSSSDKTKLDAVVDEKYADRGDPFSVDGSIPGGLVADGTWRGINLESLGVPAGAASRLIHLRCRIVDDAIGTAMMFRKSGNSSEINAAKAVTVVANDSVYFDAWVVCNAFRQIEYKIDTGMAVAEFTVAGWMI